MTDMDLMAKQIEEQRKEIERAKSHLSHIETCLLVLKNTKSEEGIKDFPYLIGILYEYVEQALKGEK